MNKSYGNNRSLRKVYKIEVAIEGKEFFRVYDNLPFYIIEQRTPNRGQTSHSGSH